MMNEDMEMKDQLLQDLIDRMEDVLAGGLQKRKGMAVEVMAEDKEDLKKGLEKAEDVIEAAPEMKPASKEEDEMSDEERLAALVEEEEEEEK